MSEESGDCVKNKAYEEQQKAGEEEGNTGSGKFLQHHGCSFQETGKHWRKGDQALLQTAMGKKV